MIKLEVNGSQQTIYSGSTHELRSYLTDLIPPGEVLCSMRVNGQEIAESQLDTFSIDGIQRVEVSSGLPADLARGALGETAEWITRICTALDSVARQYRMGQEKVAAGELVSVIDALNVLVELLKAIDTFLPVDLTASPQSQSDWKEAEDDLHRSLKGLLEDMEAGDPIRLADRAGYAVPRSLMRFREVLGRLPA